MPINTVCPLGGMDFPEALSSWTLGSSGSRLIPYNL